MKRNFSYTLWMLLISISLIIGCKKTEEQPTPTPDPTADFSFSPSSPKAGDQITFTNNSQNADSFEWSSSAAGFSSTTKNPTFTFTQTGIFEVTLVAKKGTKSATSKKSMVVATATTTPAPVANFTFSPATPKVGDQITFSNTSQNATSFEWSSSPLGFGATTQNPTFTFTQAGTYQITLKAIGAAGASNTITKAIIVAAAQTLPPPVANFGFSPDAPKVGETVTFSNTSQNATAFEWSSSPAGFTSKAQNPTYSFTQAGTYQITLKVTGEGGTTQLTRSITVSESGSSTADPCTGSCFPTKTTTLSLGYTIVVTYEYVTINSKKYLSKASTNTIGGTITWQYKYDAQGRMTRADGTTINNVTLYLTYEYVGNNSKPSRQNSYNANNVLETYTTNQYNGSNFLIRANNYLANGTLQTYTTNEDFTAEGNPRLSKTFDANGTLQSTVTTQYQGCLPTKIVSRDASGNITSDHTTTIDTKGVIRKALTITYQAGFTVNSNTDYVYDCD